MKDRRGLILIGLGAALFLGALVLTGYNLWDQMRAGEAAARVMEEMETLIPAPGTAGPSLGPVEGEISPGELSPAEVEMPTVTVDGFEYIGYLSIPTLDLSLPVMSQWSYEELKKAPCRYSGSTYADNLVICAHNYARHFGALGTLKLDDVVQFVDAEGNQTDYLVVGLEEIDPYDIQEMVAGEYDLSLFTCNFSGQLRTTVRCNRL